MNQRIKELAEQCETTYIDRDGRRYAEFDKEKFAELIVRKCIKMVENEAAQYAEPVWAFELVNDMHEHFGVNDE